MNGPFEGQPLTGSDGPMGELQQPHQSSSVASNGASSSGGRSSLLERIQQQRDREAAAQVAQPVQHIPVPSTATPAYDPSSPIAQQERQIGGGSAQGVHISQSHYETPSVAGYGGGGPSPEASSDFFASSWNTMTANLETAATAGVGSSSEIDGGHAMSDALLPPTARGSGAHHGRMEDDYSMSNYAMTFVNDIYGLFMRLHVILRVLVVMGLVYVAIKLL